MRTAAGNGFRGYLWVRSRRAPITLIMLKSLQEYELIDTLIMLYSAAVSEGKEETGLTFTYTIP